MRIPCLLSTTMLACSVASGQTQTLKVISCPTFPSIYFLPGSTDFLNDTALYKQDSGLENPMDILADMYRELTLDSVCLCVLGNYAVGEDSVIARARAMKVIDILLASGIHADQLRWGAGNPENRKISDQDRGRLESDAERTAADKYNRHVSFTYCAWWSDGHRVNQK